MAITYFIDDIQIVSSLGSITSECAMTSNCENDRGYSISVKVSGSCNSAALAKCVPNTSVCIDVDDSTGKKTSYTGKCCGAKTDECQSGTSPGSCEISCSGCTATCV